MGKYALVEFWRPRPERYSLSSEEKERFVEGSWKIAVPGSNLTAQSPRTRRLPSPL
jgi:hypothetical protein